MARRTHRPWRSAACVAAGAVWIAFLSWGFLGCGGDDGAAPPPGGGNVVGPAGGTVASADGRAAVTVPAGALTREVAITVAPVASPPPGALPGTVYELGPESIAFALPATLRLEYDPATLPGGVDEASLRLGKLHGTTWLGVAGGAADTLANRVTGSLSGFSTYGVLPPGGDGEIDSLTVVVVDSPPPGSTEQFPTLAAALAWLGTQLSEEDLGIVILQTNATQSLASLALPFDLRLLRASGYDPAIAGPGAAPLVVDAAGAFNLCGLRVVNAGGLIINANRRLALSGCALPATAVNVGGVKSAPFPAGDPGFAAKRGAARRAAGADISGNTFGGDLAYRLQADIATSASYTVSGNTGAGLSLGGIGTLRASSSLQLLDNAFGFIDADLKMDGQAALSVANHDALSRLSLAGEAAGGNPTVTLTGNVSADLQLSCKGLGKMTVNAAANDITSGRVDLSIKDYEFFGINQSYVDLAIIVGSAIANPDILWNEVGAVFDGLTFDAVNTPDGRVTFGLERVRFNGDVAFNSKAELNLQLTDDVTFNAAAEVRVQSNLLDLRQTRVTYAGSAKFVAQGASAGVAITSTGGEFRDHAQIIAPPAVGIAISLDETAFTRGGIFYVGPTEKSTRELDVMASRGPEAVLAPARAAVAAASVAGSATGGSRKAPGVAARAAPARPTAPAARAGGPAAAQRGRAEPSVSLHNVTFDREGMAHIAIERTDCAVVVENCPLLASAAAGAVLAVEAVTGAVTIRDNSFRGGGVGVVGCAQPVDISGNTLDIANQQSIAFSAAECGTVTIAGNEVTCEAGVMGGAILSNPAGLVTVTGNSMAAASAVLVATFGRVNADSNPLLSGSILIARSTLHLAGNVLALGDGAAIVDPYGGLLNDPAENDGFDPVACFTIVDFDGNGCCDYPPDANEPDEHGQCPCLGVPPQGGR